eukprot:TRINITY_DN1845_c0_g1_i1.p1 TRINITY_DN1845_c0_g1~~TRINITY_DN1845_c0_g1_i1.p1  ORF type:complete len:254 (-),score=65.12 TRINITY_DN1845_c0_g1_i1:106-867(-)
MARSSLLAVGVLAAVVTALLSQVNQVFVPSSATSGTVYLPTKFHAARRSVIARRAEETEAETETEEAEEEAPPEIVFKRYRSDRGIDLDGDKLDNLDEWYEEGIKGQGGMPSGFMKDLVLRSFFGEVNSKGYFEMSRDYTGPRGRPSDGDFTMALETMKQHIKNKVAFRGQDDGKGWIWLAALQNPGGLELSLTASPPYGERPLALIKADNIDEFFAKADWHRLFVRLHKWNLWGGKAKKFPFPLNPRMKSVY